MRLSHIRSVLYKNDCRTIFEYLHLLSRELLYMSLAVRFPDWSDLPSVYLPASNKGWVLYELTFHLVMSWLIGRQCGSWLIGYVSILFFQNIKVWDKLCLDLCRFDMKTVINRNTHTHIYVCRFDMEAAIRDGLTLEQGEAHPLPWYLIWSWRWSRWWWRRWF